MPFPWLPPIRLPADWSAMGESLMRLMRPLVATSLMVSGTTLGLRYLGWLEFAELVAYDHFIQQQPDRGLDDRLLVVGITENDLQTLQEYPISDRTLALALKNLQALQPEVIGVDVFRDFPNEPGHAQLMQQLQQHPNTLIICKASSVDDLGTPPPPGLPLEQVGFADLTVDPGGILRRSLLYMTPPQPERPFPKQHLCNDPANTLLSLSFRATILYLQARGVEPGFNPAGQLTLGSTVVPQIAPNIGGYHQADTAGYQVMLHYRSETNAVAQVSLMDVLEGRVDPALVRDRIVLLGYTTPQAKDDFYTPYSFGRDDDQKMPGVVVHAQAASQLLATALDGAALIWVWPASVDLLWIVAWSLVGGLLGWYFRHPAAFALVIGLGAGGLYALGLVIFLESGWIPVVPPALTFIGTAVGVVLLDRFNNSAYGQQVYRKVKTLLHLDIDIDEAKLEKQVAEITETDYFKDLQDTVKTLRDQSDSADSEAHSLFHQAVPGWDYDQHGISTRAEVTTGNHRSVSQPEQDDLALLLAPQEAERPRPTESIDYLDQLQQQAESLKTKTQPQTAPGQGHLPQIKIPGEDPAAPGDSDYELDFINQINQTAQALRQVTTPTETTPADDSLGYLDALNAEAQRLKQPSPSPTLAATYSPFSLDRAFCRCSDTSTATRDYINYIDQEIKALKQEIRNRAASASPEL